MPPRKRGKPAKRPIESYQHRDKDRPNNPPVGLVTPETDRDDGRTTYEFDPHLDPQLQWAGKAEHTSFEVPTVSLHVHERIDPRTIIDATRKRNGNGFASQGSLFELPEENPPIRSAIEFYRHRQNWTNRLVAGDSLLVMNSLLQKEGMAGKVQMVYIDPPYGIRYGSNFQPFVNRRDVRDGRDEDLTQEPETIKAFRDTWELGIHSYLSYLRDRLLLSRELLTESGSCFVQISDENVHRVRAILDEVFGEDNFVSLISFNKTSGFATKFLPNIADYLLWYGKDVSRLKFRQLMLPKQAGEAGATSYQKLGRVPGSFPRIDSTRLARSDQLTSQGGSSPDVPLTIMGKSFTPRSGMHWKTTTTGLRRLGLAGRLGYQGQTPAYLRFFDDFPVFQISNQWNDTGIAGYAANKVYVVQTLTKVVERCIQMTTDPGDLVLDPTCGSGTTAIVAEQWGRRWVTCDTSRVAISLAKQRLMTAHFNYYELAHPEEGVGSGFKYRTVPHIMLRDIANNLEIDSIWERHQESLVPLQEQLNASLGKSWEEWEIPRDADDGWPEEGKRALAAWWERRLSQQKEIDEAIARNAGQETLYDQPLVDNSRKRVTGPFSVEAVPAPVVKPIDDGADVEVLPADTSVARSGETLRQSEWRDELLKTGIRGKAGQFIRFARLEPLPDCRWLNADGESLPNDDGVRRIREGAAQASQRIVVSFGPEHAPLEQRQVNQALQEAETLRPQPKVLVFAAFQFDPEAAKDIDETNWPGVTLLKAQMNADLLTEDLKRKRASNESFWLIGQPDVRVEPLGRGDEGNKYQVSVQGFDYYNTQTGDVESGRQDKIAMWMLDTDYDGRSLYPRQVFFPMAGPGDGWARLARNLKAEIDEELIEAYRGATSLPFDAGEHRRIAVKIVDDRGIESLKVIGLDAGSAGISPVERKGETLEQVLDDVAKRLPQEVKDQFPNDFLENMDHYLYGADKR